MSDLKRKTDLVFVKEHDLDARDKDQLKATPGSTRSNGRDKAVCDRCIRGNKEVPLARLLCFQCKLYLCDNCKGDHLKHLCLHDDNGTGRNKKRKRQKCRNRLVEYLMNEDSREENFNVNHVEMYERIHVKHDLDHTDCNITGLCVLNEESLVICDYNNHAIKIWDGHNMGRYIRSKCPFDVTEINKLDFNPTTRIVEPKPPENTKNIDATANNSLIAVTFPNECQVLVLNTSEKPALIYKNISVDGQCFGIEFHNKLLHIVCLGQSRGSKIFVQITTIDGIKLTNVYTEPYRHCYTSYMLMAYESRYPGKHIDICISSYFKNMVEWLMNTGDKTDEVSVRNAGGVRVDSRIIYCADDGVQGRVHENQLDNQLTKSLVDTKMIESQFPQALGVICTDKLFVSHAWYSPQRNFVAKLRIV